MKTAQQKQKKWLDECGFVDEESFVVYLRTHNKKIEGTRYFNTDWNEKILSLTNPDGKIHIPPADLHEDDIPEPKDKALQEYLKGGVTYQFNDMMEEFNSRLKALESERDGGEK